MVRKIFQGLKIGGEIMQGQMAGAAVVAVSVAVIVAAILLVPIADTTNRATIPQSITNESVTAAEGDWVYGDNNVTLTYDNVLVGTETITNDTATLSNGVEYVIVNATGVISFIQTNTSVNTTWNVSYSYYDDIYQTNSLDRAITGYVPVVIAATIIAAAAAKIML